VRTDIPGLDELLATVEQSVDRDTRVEASLAAEKLIAENIPGIPVATVPNILMTNDRIGGPLQINPSEGPFWNLEKWTVG
jgi:peptide/nickel transport system substrate-binding protein